MFEGLTRKGHKVYANLAGYFWLPCDWCGFEFGGHEDGWKSRPAGSNEPLLCFRCAPNYLTENPENVEFDIATIRHFAEQITHTINKGRY